MILVDKEIEEYVEKNQLIISEFDKSNLGSVSYDLTVDIIISDAEETSMYDLKPGETVFVKTKEKIKIPNDILGRVGEKNSRMRQGLVVAAPHYHPGHSTYVYLRVQNISGSIIRIRQNSKIAQIFFEKLTGVPKVTYDRQNLASFNDEVEYRGLGNYETEYLSDMKKYSSAKEDLENKEARLYANILTLMGIFISMFSLITINFSSLTVQNFSVKKLCVINISLALVVTVLMGLILIFINKAKSKWFLVGYCVILVSLILVFALLVKSIA